MRTLIAAFIACFFLPATVHAQKFKHSVGGTVFVIGAKGTRNVTTTLGFSHPEQYNFIMESVGVTYFPRINFETGANASFSIGIPLSIGAGVASDFNNENTGIYFAYDVPVIADYNLGRGSTAETEKKFGYFLGAGFGYGYVNIALDAASQKVNSYGPLVHGGTRFQMGGRGGGLTIGLYYKQGLESWKYKTVGIQVLSDL